MEELKTESLKKGYVKDKRSGSTAAHARQISPVSHRPRWIFNASEFWLLIHNSTSYTNFKVLKLKYIGRGFGLFSPKKFSLARSVDFTIHGRQIRIDRQREFFLN